MNKLDKQAILEGVKELIRTSLIAVIPLLITQLQLGQSIDWKPIAVAGSIALLSGIDKWAHKKDYKSPLDLQGMDTLLK